MGSEKKGGLFRLAMAFSFLAVLALFVLLAFSITVSLFEVQAIKGALSFIAFFFSVSLVLFGVQIVLIAKHFGLKKKPGMLVIYVVVNSLMITIAFFIFNLLIIWSARFYPLLQREPILIGAAFLTALLAYKLVRPYTYAWILNIFFKFKRRKDLEKRYSSKMKELGVKAKIFSPGNDFFNIANAAVRLPKSEIVLTEDIEKILTEKELEGVILHEIGHIKNRWRFLLTITAGIIATTAILLIGLFLTESLMPTLPFIVIALVIFARKNMQAFDREADEMAKEYGDAKAYVSALKKLRKYNKMPELGILKLLDTHPKKSKREKP